MARATAEKTVGQRIIEGLSEFRDALANDENLEQRFTVRTISIPDPPQFNAKEVASLRAEMNASQAVFAKILGVSPVLERQWEGGIRTPNAAACRLLEMVSRDPRGFMLALMRSASLSTRPAGADVKVKPADHKPTRHPSRVGRHKSLKHAIGV